ncbi:MAG: 1-acyl-sn-glycerol-3-phosphate acyltransferase [Chitinophagaceae bacterium]
MQRLLYAFLKLIARAGILIYSRRVFINKPDLLKIKGPLLLAANHPNSFLDSVILNTLFEQPVWSLARGDAFKNPLFARALRALRILPVYRTSEGVENLSENYKTFSDCLELFKRDGIITIFSEGLCVNEWHLRPLKKGTARLVIRAWDEQIPLRVLPVGINYSSFTRFGKNIFIRFGKIIEPEQIRRTGTDGAQYLSFNARLTEELEQLVMEIPANDRQLQEEKLAIRVPLWKKILLAFPAFAGWIFHAPLYYPVKRFTSARTRSTGHYDSVMTAILLLAYPVYLVFLVSLAWLFTGTAWVLGLFPLLPVCARSLVELKPQLDPLPVQG